MTNRFLPPGRNPVWFPDGVNILVDCGTASGDDPVLPFAQFPVPPDTRDCPRCRYQGLPGKMLVDWAHAMPDLPEEIRWVDRAKAA